MTASNILHHAEAAGLKLQMHNGKVRVSGKGPRPTHLLAELQKYREDIAHLLTLRERLQSAESSPGLLYHSFTQAPKVPKSVAA